MVQKKLHNSGQVTRFIQAIVRNQSTYLVLFLLSPFLVYFDVIFGGFTISSNEVGANPNQRFGRILPVLDPLAGSLQDHPWLAKIGHSLRQFSIPLINLDNGIGAPLLESMQSGVLYPLNFLLVFMDLSSSQFFDLFSVFHIFILLINAFVLFKLYIRWELALVLALAMAFGWSTFLLVNMVHYRSFVWAPLITWAAVKMARNQYSMTTILIAIFAIFCSVTAGNPQESFFDLIAACIFFGAESVVSGKIRWQAIAIFLLSFLAGILIASPSFIPYVVSKSQGLLLSVESPDRSKIAISFPWLLGWIIQYINGTHPRWYRETTFSGDDYAVFAVHPLFIFLIFVGIFVIFLNRTTDKRRAVLFFLLLGAGLTSLLNTTVSSPFREILTQIPFVNTLRYPKYIHHIHLLFATSAAIALFLALDTPFKLRRRCALLGFTTLVLTIIAIVLFNLVDPAWQFNSRRIDQLLMVWGGSIFAVLSGLFVLLTSQHSLKWRWFFGSILIVSLLIKPYGFFKALTHHSPFPIQGIDLTQQRILSNAEVANSNLLRNYEQIGVFDPILNKEFAIFMAENFKLTGILLNQVAPDVLLTAKQVDILRLIGVTSIYRHPVQDGTFVTRLSSDFIKVNNPLPKVFLVNSTQAIEAACEQRDYTRAIAEIQAATISQPASFQKAINDLRFKLDYSGQGTLVSLQAFSTGWQLNGVKASKFCRAFNAWQGDFQAGTPYQLTYLPPGLQLSYRVALMGILLMLMAVGLSNQPLLKSEKS